MARTTGGGAAAIARISTRPIVTRMIGAAAGGPNGLGAGVVEEESGGTIGSRDAGGAGAGADAGTGEGAAAATETPLPDAGEISRTRSVTCSIRSVLGEGGGNEKFSRAPLLDAAVKGRAGAGGASGDGAGAGELTGVATGGGDENPGGGAETGGSPIEGSDTAVFAVSGGGAADGAAKSVIEGKGAAAAGPAATVSMFDSENRAGLGVNSKREGRRGWTVAVEASERSSKRRRKVLMRPPVQDTSGGGPD